jgi:hypothetical protein
MCDVAPARALAILCSATTLVTRAASRPREANALRRAPDLSKLSACISSADLQTSPRTHCGVRSDRSPFSPLALHELMNPPTAGLGCGKYSSAVPISHWLPNYHDFPTRLLGVLLASTSQTFTPRPTCRILLSSARKFPHRAPPSAPRYTKIVRAERGRHRC